MSTEFITEPGIPLRAFRGFNHRGVRATEETDDSLVLTDGTNYVQVCAESDDDDTPCFVRNGTNDPMAILDAVVDRFGVRVISEYDDEWHEMVERISARAQT